MEQIMFNNVLVRKANENDSVFVQYTFGLSDVRERCKIQNDWIGDVTGYINYICHDKTNWFWIIEDLSHNKVGLLMNYIAPALNGLPALWSSYAIIPRYRKKHFAVNALMSVPSLFKDMLSNFACLALLIADDNQDSIKVAEKSGYIKFPQSGGFRNDGLIVPNETIWLKFDFTV